MDIYFDSTHDVTLLNGDIRLTSTDEDIKQRLTIALQFLSEEWFLDTSVGLPYTQVIFDVVKNSGVVYGLFRSEISNVEGVETIDELLFTLTKDEKELQINLTVNSTITVEVVV